MMALDESTSILMMRIIQNYLFYGSILTLNWNLDKQRWPESDSGLRYRRVFGTGDLWARGGAGGVLTLDHILASL